MRERLQSAPGSMEMEEGDMFEDEKLELRLNMARSCLQQNNFSLALRILKETFSVRATFPCCVLTCYMSEWMLKNVLFIF